MTRTGDRTRIRPMTLDDLPAYERWQAPDAEYHRWNGPYYPRSTPEEIDRSIALHTRWIENGHEPDPHRRWTIADLESDRLVGTVNRYWISRETNWPALGIVLYDPQSWGRGLGRQALGLWVDELFEAYPELVRLDLRTWSGNERMCRVAETLGFTLEARFRKARIVEGEYFDGVGYGLLREEWEESRYDL